MTPLLLAMSGLLALLVGLAVTELLIRRPLVAAGVIFAVTFLEAAFVDTLVGVMAGGIAIKLADIVAVALTVAAVGRMLRRLPLTATQWVLIVLSLLAVFSLTRGIGSSGLEEAFNEFRGWTMFFGAALYFSTVDVERLFPTRLRNVWLWGAVAMGVLVVSRWAAWLIGLPIGPLEATFDSPVRVINGPQTFFLALAFILTLPAWTGRANDLVARRASVALSISVILLNRRTVWAALVVGLLVLIVRSQRLGRRLAMMLVIGATATAMILITLPEEVSEGSGNVARGATDTGTFDWRLQGWIELLGDPPKTRTELAFGRPMGSGYTRRVGSVVVDVQPHNFYLQIYLRLGLVGLLLFIVLYASAGRVLLRASRGHPTSVATLLLVLLSAQSLYLITWAPGLEQGILAGVFAAAVTRRSALRTSATPVVAERQSANEPAEQRPVR